MPYASCIAWVIASPLVAAAPPERPADVDLLMSNVSPQQLRATIDKLVTFGTRHTLSDREDPARGIGAAARWLRDELASYAKASGRDDIVVELMEHVQPSAARRRGEPPANSSTQPATTAATQSAAERPGIPITNVVMTIPGAMPEARDRRFVVLGHYDSRNGRGNDAQGDAPRGER